MKHAPTPRGTWIAVLTCVALLALCWGLTAGAGAKEDKAGKDKPKKEAGWISLFNGKDLTGWTKRGGGIFKVEDGCLVGTQTDGKGGDLYHETDFDNFELQVTYRMVWPANSGFWYRYDPKKNRGYQYDVLKYKKPVAFSGTLYCPGKLFLFANLKEELENRDGWNEARVLADGKKLTHWLNGTKTGEATDDSFKNGRIAIQVHPGGFKGMKVIIKRMEIRPIKASAPPAKKGGKGGAK